MKWPELTSTLTYQEVTNKILYFKSFILWPSFFPSIKWSYYLEYIGPDDIVKSLVSKNILDYEHWKCITLSNNIHNITIWEENQNKSGKNEITEVSLPSNLVVLENQLALVYQWDLLGPVIKEEKKDERRRKHSLLHKELNGGNLNLSSCQNSVLQFWFCNIITNV